MYLSLTILLCMMLLKWAIFHDTSVVSVFFSTSCDRNGKKNFRVKRDKSNERLVLNIGHNSSFCTTALPHFTGAMLLFEPMNRVFHAQSYEYSELSIFKSLFRIIQYYQHSLDTIGISEKLHIRMAKRF